MLIAGNWKMYKGPAETREFCAAFAPPGGVDAVLCPPFGSLGAAVASGHVTYAQNVHWADEGAFTGEVSTKMLLELGVHRRRRGARAARGQEPARSCGHPTSNGCAAAVADLTAGHRT